MADSETFLMVFRTYDFAPFQNPRHCACHLDEDVIGRMKLLACIGFDQEMDAITKGFGLESEEDHHARARQNVFL